MGLLDDAIREHLDLKRRRGADPAEIERAEREALGPVRRNREPGASDEAEGTVTTSLDPAIGSAFDEPDEGTASDLVDESYGDEEFADDGPSAVPAAGGTFLDEDEFDDAEAHDDEGAASRASGDDPFAEEEDPHRTQLMSTVDAPPPDDATAVHDVEQSFAEDEVREPRPRADDHRGGEQRSDDRPGDEQDGEDVLEETPEFLQDTPDHDRLWFEQRPPRDFDFDG